MSLNKSYSGLMVEKEYNEKIEEEKMQRLHQFHSYS